MQGATLPVVVYIEFFLNVLSQKYDAIEPVEIDTFYGPDTDEAVRQFQIIMGLNPTGIVDQQTLNLLFREAYLILTETPVEELELPVLPFIGMELTEGMGLEYPRILLLQIMLNAISAIHPEIRPVEIDGIYGPDTTAAVIIFQNLYGLPVTGIVNEETWNKLNEVYQLSLLERETNT